MRKDGKRRVGVGAVIAGIIAGTIALEGGYVNHRSDPGGETNMGITKRTAVAHGYFGPMRQLPREVAESIYYQSYLVQPGYAPLVAIDAAVTEELFDTAVNMGPARPSSWFQASINALCGTALPVDGKVGAGTIAAYRICQTKIGAARLCRAMLDALDARQRAEYDRLVRANRKLQAFHRGWIAHRIGNVDRATCEVRRTASRENRYDERGAGA
jgi:lysozyme family protein